MYMPNQIESYCIVSNNDNKAYLIGGHIGYNNLVNDLVEFNARGVISTIHDEKLNSDNISVNEYQLFPNYPNLFNPTTFISFSLPK